MNKSIGQISLMLDRESYNDLPNSIKLSTTLRMFKRLKRAHTRYIIYSYDTVIDMCALPTSAV